MEKIGRPYAHHPDRPATTAERVRAHRHKSQVAPVHYLPASREPGVYTMDLDALIASGQQFRCIYADPLWRYQDQPPKGGVAKRYLTMDLDALQALPVPLLAAPKAHLHLWTTKDFQFEAKAVIEAWGFTWKAEVVWVKTTRDGKTIRLGTGHYLRNAHEVLYVGVRSGLPPQQRNIPSVLLAPRGLHSEKPEAMRDRVEQFSPGPYLELFGRASVPGWTVWGNECHPANGRLFKEAL
jgi:N6-adenosine-specific RNA methylase IME4